MLARLSPRLLPRLKAALAMTRAPDLDRDPLDHEGHRSLRLLDQHRHFVDPREGCENLRGNRLGKAFDDAKTPGRRRLVRHLGKRRIADRLTVIVRLAGGLEIEEAGHADVEA